MIFTSGGTPLNHFYYFQRKMLRNYIIGSLTAVFGVGSIFIFRTLEFTESERLFLLIIMCISISTMFTLEWLLYCHHVRPIKDIFFTKRPTIQALQLAYQTIQKFPWLTVKRILGPHFLGLAVPSSGLVIACIYFGKINLPYYYVGLAWVGALLVASMHALIEFFLTYRAVQPLITFLLDKAERDFRQTLQIKNKDYISIKTKLLVSTIFISVFPILLFSLASNIHLGILGLNNTDQYWDWAILILFVILFLAVFSSLLLYENIQKPIETLQASLQFVQDGELRAIKNTYSDEFSHLISGFNTMVDAIQKRDERNESLLESFYVVFAATLDARDPYTAGHSIRVADYSILIAEKAGLSDERIDLLKKSALLHDIGKIGIRDSVLLKEGKLSDEEFDTIKQHPVIGAHILEQINLTDELKPLLPGVKYHHERYDGKGYPEGLKGEDIPLFGRIMAVADAYDAMTSDRPYRKGMPQEKAISILEEGKGTQWDPIYTELFIQAIKERH
jgi:putative nucleotidyltransferase with HDIG domain